MIRWSLVVLLFPLFAHAALNAGMVDGVWLSTATL